MCLHSSILAFTDYVWVQVDAGLEGEAEQRLTALQEPQAEYANIAGGVAAAAAAHTEELVPQQSSAAEVDVRSPLPVPPP